MISKLAVYEPITITDQRFKSVALQRATILSQALLLYLLLCRQLNSFIADLLLGSSAISIVATGSAIIVVAALYWSSAVVGCFRVAENKNLIIMLFAFFCWFTLSNRFSEVIGISGSNWYSITNLWVDFIVSFFVWFALLGLVRSAELSHHFPAVMKTMFWVVLTGAVFAGYTSLQLIALKFAGDIDDNSLVEGANRMILGKAYFFALCLASFIFLRSDGSPHPLNITLHGLKRFVLFLLITSFLLFLSIILAARTGFLSWIFFLCGLLLVSPKRSRRKLAEWIFCSSLALFLIFVFALLFLIIGDYSFPFLLNPFERLDSFTSSRFSGALFGILFFLEHSVFQPMALIIGYGNYDSAILFKNYFGTLTSMWLPERDLAYYWEQQGGFSPHDSYIDILISNGLVGFIMMFTIVIFVLLKTRYMALRVNDFVLRWYFAVCFAIAASFFSSDLDFLGGRLILNVFVLAAGGAAVRYHLYCSQQHQNKYLLPRPLSQSVNSLSTSQRP